MYQLLFSFFVFLLSFFWRRPHYNVTSFETPILSIHIRRESLVHAPEIIIIITINELYECSVYIIMYSYVYAGGNYVGRMWDSRIKPIYIFFCSVSIIFFSVFFVLLCCGAYAVFSYADVALIDMNCVPCFWKQSMYSNLGRTTFFSDDLCSVEYYSWISINVCCWSAFIYEQK